MNKLANSLKWLRKYYHQIRRVTSKCRNRFLGIGIANTFANNLSQDRMGQETIS